ncbi:MAG: 3-hydroxyacyl-CoA dehydrogenase family protein [Planctomycetota bacterium]
MIKGGTDSLADDAPAVMLIGAGVVGRAIARDHLRAGIPVWLVDHQSDALQAACDELTGIEQGIWMTASPWGARVPLPIVALSPSPNPDAVLMSSGAPSWLVIESIAERLDAKQTLFAECQHWFDRPPTLTSNTSTLSITQISETIEQPQRFTGLHFFMPVVGRHAVEVIPHAGTSNHAIEICQHHADRLSKAALLVKDSPGFVVNRMLAPYLNLAMWLLCGGVQRTTLREAALAYGMPISPLELIELISPATAFDGGRVVWQAFPDRLNPSPLLPAMVKRSRRGEHGWDAPEVDALIERYRHHHLQTVDNDPALVARMMATVMHVEASLIVQDDIADRPTIDGAMAGGLGWRSPADDESSWSHFVETQLETRLATRYPMVPELRVPER